MTDRTDLPSLAGKVIVVTGASSGLGAGLAARFAERGASLALCARRLPTAPGSVPSLRRSVDVTDAAAVEAFADEADTELGPVDLWINNAGVLGPVRPARESSPAEIREALLVNVGGVMHGSAAFVRRARGWPVARRMLANISSGAATSVYRGWSTYGATKAAVDHYTRILAEEEPDLVVHSVAPGVIDTPMQDRIRESDAADFPALDRFVELKRTGSWNSPPWIADHLAAVLVGSSVPEGVCFRVPNEPR